MWVWLAFAGCQGEPEGGKPAPAPESGCATGQLLDADVCVPEACGVGRWGNVAEAGVYVDVDAAEGGDGSEGAPLRSIQAGLDLAADHDGGIVAVAAGTYVETIGMASQHHGVTLAGRCRELVTIDGSEGDEDEPAIEVIGERRRPEVGIEGVTVTGGTGSGLWVEWAVVSVWASDVRASTGDGFVAVDAEAWLDHVGIFDSRAERSGHYGYGIEVSGASDLTAIGCIVQGNTDIGILAAGTGTTVHLEGTDVLDTLPRSDGSFGQGVHVRGGAGLTATGCTVRGNTGAGVFAGSAETAVDLTDTAILDALPDDDGLGLGIEVADGAALTATRCTIAGSIRTGVYVEGLGTTVDLVDTSILDTSPSPGDIGGMGISVGEQAVLTATGCTVQGNTDVGVLVNGAGTRVELEDTQVLDTSSSPDGTGGRGIGAEDGAAVTATRCTLQGNTEIGVFALGVGTTIDLVDTEILDTLARDDGLGGRGIGVQDGAALTATGCTLQGNTEVGARVSGEGARVDLLDTEILDTFPGPGGDNGTGIGAEDGSALTATGCTVQGNTGAGVFATDAGTTVDLVDTEILETRRGRVTGFGVGVLAQLDAVVRVRDSEVADTEGPGLYVTGSARGELDSVALTGNHFAGAMVLAGTVALTASAITDTLPDAEWGGGIGIYATDEFGSPTLTLADSTVGPHAYAAVWLDGQGSYDVQRNTLSGSEGVEAGNGRFHGNAVFAEHGVTAWDDASGLRLWENTFEGASEVAVLLDGASAELDGNAFSGNGIDLWQQRCDDIVPLSEEDLDWEVCPDGNLLTAYDLVFTSLYLPEVEPLE